jgi:hypothetical protein
MNSQELLSNLFNALLPIVLPVVVLLIITFIIFVGTKCTNIIAEYNDSFNVPSSAYSKPIISNNKCNYCGSTKQSGSNCTKCGAPLG